MKRFFILILTVGIIIPFSCSENKEDQNSEPTEIDTVVIGTQTWTTKNLDVTTYRNGDPIPQVSDPTEWEHLTTGAWCYYNNDPASDAVYGKLYNWYAVNDPRGLAPAGYHIPNYGEWHALMTYLGGTNVAGGKMKATSLWASPNTGADNSSGFTGLPGGFRFNTGQFTIPGQLGLWWSTSEALPYLTNVWVCELDHDKINMWISSYYIKNNGLSVRFVKDGSIALPLIATSNIVPAAHSSSAQSGGNITSEGSSAITAKGVVWSTSTNPTIDLPTKTNEGSGTGIFTSNIIGLSPSTLYYVRAYAINNEGIAYGNQLSFTTSDDLARVSTASIFSGTNASSAQSGGSISRQGGSSIIAKGIVWSTSTNPTIDLPTKTNNGDGTSTFTSSMTGLTPNTLYYVRAYATNNDGTAYGNEMHFTASDDLIPSVTIGTQTWMLKNLNVPAYRNGDPIPQVTDATEWANLTTGAWCYTWDGGSDHTGRLYNWYAVNDPRGLAPVGWHVPSDAEWTTLSNFLGVDAGGKMKATNGFVTPNFYATNSSGFTGIGAGWRDGNGVVDTSFYGYFWSSSEDNANTTAVWLRRLSYLGGELGRWSSFKRYGFSVRCVRD